MEKLLGSTKLKIYELSNQTSHAAATVALKNGQYDFAVFFAHGGSNYLRGGEYQIRATGENIETEKFLTHSDLPLFQGKVVFCMSCDSNGMAGASLDSGVQSFVGFDKIPFNRFDDKGEPIGSFVLVKHCQEILADSVKLALERFLKGEVTLDESIELLRMVLVKRAIEYVRKHPSVKERREIAALLLQTKNGILYHGQKGIRFG